MQTKKYKIYLLLFSAGLLHGALSHGQGVEIQANGQINNVKTPTASNDLANKAYMDSVVLEFAIAFGSTDLPSLFPVQKLIDKGYTVQELLNFGYRPLQLIQASAGITANSLYGKTFQGGLIFYIDIQDVIPGVEGYVAAPAGWNGTGGVPDDAAFGCSGTDINPSNVPDATIGTGQANTDRIIDLGCSDPSGPEPDAANLCHDLVREGYDDWFLPSQDEFVQMAGNLHNKGFGGFEPAGTYWLSTEFVSASNGSTFAYSFFSGPIVARNKSTFNRVRPIRSF